MPLLPTGSDAAAPHLTWDDTPFREGEGTFFEIAGCYKRYHCPLSRTVFLGKPPRDFVRGESALLEGIENGLAVAKPGNRTADIALALGAAMDKYGFDRGGARCGYPIGISYPPDWGERTMSLRPSDETILQPGMTFHIIPWMWGVDGDKTCGISDTIYITEEGCESFFTMDRDFTVKPEQGTKKVAKLDTSAGKKKSDAKAAPADEAPSAKAANASKLETQKSK